MRTAATRGLLGRGQPGGWFGSIKWALARATQPAECGIVACVNTKVRFPQGALTAEARVVWSGVLPGRDQAAVVTDQTPFHPLDHTWPDQPADRGTLAGVEVLDCLTGATQANGELLLGTDIPARRGDPEWEWLVVHLLPLSAPLPAPGELVELCVDAGYRESLSVGHTACHLAALALNLESRSFWRKQAPRLDSLGSADLDGIAIQRSVITPFSATDDYKLGKSIRKKGLNVADLLLGLADLQTQVTARLEQWTNTDASVTIQVPSPDVIARRLWQCPLPEGLGEYPCGGTHVRQLAELGRIAVSYQESDFGFTAITTATGSD